MAEESSSHTEAMDDVAEVLNRSVAGVVSYVEGDGIADTVSSDAVAGSASPGPRGGQAALGSARLFRSPARTNAEEPMELETIDELTEAEKAVAEMACRPESTSDVYSEEARAAVQSIVSDLQEAVEMAEQSQDEESIDPHIYSAETEPENSDDEQIVIASESDSDVGQRATTYDAFSTFPDFHLKAKIPEVKKDHKHKRSHKKTKRRSPNKENLENTPPRRTDQGRSPSHSKAETPHKQYNVTSTSNLIPLRAKLQEMVAEKGPTTVNPGLGAVNPTVGSQKGSEGQSDLTAIYSRRQTPAPSSVGPGSAGTGLGTAQAPFVIDTSGEVTAMPSEVEDMGQSDTEDDEDDPPGLIEDSEDSEDEEEELDRSRLPFSGENHAGRIQMKMRAQYRRARGMSSVTPNPIKAGGVMFYKGRDCPSSHFFMRDFKAAGKTYNSVEQYFTAMKTACCGDHKLSDEIMNMTDPRQMKGAARSFKQYNDKKWKSLRHQVMEYGNQCKFDQNPDLREFLVGTYPQVLAEGVDDDYWGAGKDMPRSPGAAYIRPVEVPPEYQQTTRPLAGKYFLPTLWTEGPQHELPEVRELARLGEIMPCGASRQRFFPGLMCTRGLQPIPPDTPETPLKYMLLVVYWDSSRLILICGVPAMLSFLGRDFDLLDQVEQSAEDAEDMSPEERAEQARLNRNKYYLEHAHDKALEARAMVVTGPKMFLNQSLYSRHDRATQFHKVPIDPTHYERASQVPALVDPVWAPEQVSAYHVKRPPMARMPDGRMVQTTVAKLAEIYKPNRPLVLPKKSETPAKAKSKPTTTDDVDMDDVPLGDAYPGVSVVKMDESAMTPKPGRVISPYPGRQYYDPNEPDDYPPPLPAKPLTEGERNLLAAEYTTGEVKTLFHKAIPLPDFHKYCAPRNPTDEIKPKNTVMMPIHRQTDANYLSMEQEMVRRLRVVVDFRAERYHHLYFGSTGEHYTNRHLFNMVEFEPGMECPMKTARVQGLDDSYVGMHPNGSVLGCNAPPHTFRNILELTCHWKYWHTKNAASQSYCVSQVGRDNNKNKTGEPCWFSGYRPREVKKHRIEQHPEFKHTPFQHCFHHVSVSNVPELDKTLPYIETLTGTVLFCWVNMKPYMPDPRLKGGHASRAIPVKNSVEWRECYRLNAKNLGELKEKQEAESKGSKRGRSANRVDGAGPSPETSKRVRGETPQRAEPERPLSREIGQDYSESQFMRPYPTARYNRPFDAPWTKWKRYIHDCSQVTQKPELRLADSEVKWIDHEIVRYKGLMGKLKDCPLKDIVMRQLEASYNDRSAIMGLYNIGRRAVTGLVTAYVSIAETGCMVQDVADYVKHEMSRHDLQAHFMILHLDDDSYDETLAAYLGWLDRRDYAIVPEVDARMRQEAHCEEIRQETEAIVEALDHERGIAEHRVDANNQPLFCSAEDEWVPESNYRLHDTPRPRREMKPYEKIDTALDLLKLRNIPKEFKTATTANNRKFCDTYYLKVFEEAKGDIMNMARIHLENYQLALKWESQKQDAKVPNMYQWSMATDIRLSQKDQKEASKYAPVKKPSASTHQREETVMEVDVEPELLVTASSQVSRDRTNRARSTTMSASLDPRTPLVDKANPAQHYGQPPGAAALMQPAFYHGGDRKGVLPGKNTTLARTEYQMHMDRLMVSANPMEFTSTYTPQGRIAELAVPSNQLSVPEQPEGFHRQVASTCLTDTLMQLPMENNKRQSNIRQVEYAMKANTREQLSRRASEMCTLTADAITGTTAGLMAVLKREWATNAQLNRAVQDAEVKIEKLQKSLTGTQAALAKTEQQLKEAKHTIAQRELAAAEGGLSYDQLQKARAQMQQDQADLEERLNKVAAKEATIAKTRTPEGVAKRVTELLRYIKDWPERTKEEARRVLNTVADKAKEPAATGSSSDCFILPDNIKLWTPGGPQTVYIQDNEVEDILDQVGTIFKSWTERSVKRALQYRSSKNGGS